AVTGGIHTVDDVLKALMAGADITHVCSVLLKEGPSAISRLLHDLEQWMDDNEYESVAQLKGSVSRQRAIDPSAYDRANYVEVMKTYRENTGIWR
ncbi:MAG: dihydroorotate dehydrogenase-like protein, partial [Gammaproteobacteria bacterium]|nr:dihydroorotate dehydrogenase-like protein [Gammaproteobacteria bacterium]